MAEDVSLGLIGAKLDQALTELRAVRMEQRRLAENQATISQTIGNLRTEMSGIRTEVSNLRSDLELVIRTEIGGLFAHLETRLEQRIDEAVRERTTS